MGYMYEFPHTSNFDSDLRQIVEMYVNLKGLPVKFEELKKFVEDYFKNLNVSYEVSKKLDEMLTTGELRDLVSIAANEIKEVIFISDSYGTFINNNNERWYDVCARLAKITTRYATVLGGAGFTKPGEINFTNMLVSRVNAIPDTSRITHIVVGGGINDHLETEENILEAIEEFVSTANNLIPNAKVYIANIGLTFDANVHNDEMARNIRAYRNCHKVGANYLANTEYIMTNRALFGSDWVHPNADGVDAIGSAMAEALTLGGCTINYEIMPEVSASTFGGTITSNLKLFRNNERIEIIGNTPAEPNIVLTIETEAKNFNPSAFGAICQLSNSLIIGGNYEKIPCGVRLTDSNDVVYVLNGYLRGFTNAGVPYFTLFTYDNQRKFNITKVEIIV